MIAIGAFVTLSLLVFPSTNMIAYSQSENNTQVKDQAEQKLFELTQKFNTLLKDSKVNLTLPHGEELSLKLQEFAKSDAFYRDLVATLGVSTVSCFPLGLSPPSSLPDSGNLCLFYYCSYISSLF